MRLSKTPSIFLYIILLLPAVYAAPAAFMTPGTDSSDCTAIDAATVLLGYVSTQGHYRPDQPSILTDYPYVLCGINGFTFNAATTLAEADFKYAITNTTINGSNHVSTDNSTITNFTGYVDVGAEYCRYSTTGCTLDESCLFKMSNPDNAHIADCTTPDNPYVNSFAGQLCCKIKEQCWDGIDNDGDNYTDCADNDCNGVQALGNPSTPVQECTNNLTFESSPLNTSYCVTGYNTSTGTTIYSPDCYGPYPEPPFPQQAYYCGYGQSDDPAIDPIGACCPAGRRPNWNGTGWICEASQECGIDPARCSYDITLNETGWLLEEYYGDADDWCNSQIPDLYSPELPLPTRSTGCCLIPKYGQVNYYTDEDNVKIWG